MLIGYAERLMLVAPWGFGAQLVFQRLSLMYTKSPWVLVEIYHHCSFGHSERSDLRDKKRIPYGIGWFTYLETMSRPPCWTQKKDDRYFRNVTDHISFPRHFQLFIFQISDLPTRYVSIRTVPVIPVNGRLGFAVVMVTCVWGYLNAFSSLLSFMCVPFMMVLSLFTINTIGRNSAPSW